MRITSCGSCWGSGNPKGTVESTLLGSGELQTIPSTKFHLPPWQEWVSVTPAPLTCTHSRIWAPGEEQSWEQQQPLKSPQHRDKPLEGRPRRITRTLHSKNHSSKSHFYLLSEELALGTAVGSCSNKPGCKSVFRNPVRRDPDVITKCRKFWLTEYKNIWLYSPSYLPK